MCEGHGSSTFVNVLVVNPACGGNIGNAPRELYVTKKARMHGASCMCLLDCGMVFPNMGSVSIHAWEQNGVSRYTLELAQFRSSFSPH